MEPFLWCLVSLDWVLILEGRRYSLIGGSLCVPDIGTQGVLSYMVGWLLCWGPPSVISGGLFSWASLSKRNTLPGGVYACFFPFWNLCAGKRRKMGKGDSIPPMVYLIPSSLPYVLKQGPCCGWGNEEEKVITCIWGRKGLGSSCSTLKQFPWFWSRDLPLTLRYLFCWSLKSLECTECWVSLACPLNAGLQVQFSSLSLLDYSPCLNFLSNFPNVLVLHICCHLLSYSFGPMGQAYFIWKFILPLRNHLHHISLWLKLFSFLNTHPILFLPRD